MDSHEGASEHVPELVRRNWRLAIGLFGILYLLTACDPPETTDAVRTCNYSITVRDPQNLTIYTYEQGGTSDGCPNPPGLIECKRTTCQYEPSIGQ